MRPPSPVHLRAWKDSDGTLRCEWVRRSRRGWAWLDGVDAPLDGVDETYRVKIWSPAGSIEISTSEPRADLSSADIGELGGGALDVTVVQVGDLAVSHPASITIN